MKSSKAIIIVRILMVMGLLVGLGLIAYPTVSDWWNQRVAGYAISSYQESIEAIEKEELDRYFDEARAFNKELLKEPNRWKLSDELSKKYYNTLDPQGTGIMGVIQIPRIDVALPIYHGDDDTILQVATGHLEGSSLPIGETGGHAVISGHTGLPSAKLFTKLDTMSKGDRFLLEILGQKFIYQVTEINKVLPYEMGYLNIDHDRDLVTLLTCTPYGVNSHRLLVIGERVQFASEEELETEFKALEIDNTKNEFRIILIGISIAIIIVTIILIATRPSRKRKKAERNEKT